MHAKKFGGTTLLAKPVRVGEAKRALAVWASLPLSGTWWRELALFEGDIHRGDSCGMSIPYGSHSVS